MFFTGISRTASEIAKKQIIATEKKLSELDKMKLMVEEACNILCSSKFSVKDFGELLNESWHLKRSITDAISSDFIDDVYQRGLKAGAIGGKLLGAGGGGFLAFVVEKDRRERLIESLQDLLHVPFHFDQMGSHIIHYSQ